MANEFIKNLLTEQRKRLVGSIMSHAEANLYPQMTRPQQEAFREKVLSSVGAYHDTVLDILKSSVDDGTIVNEEALRLLALIHSAVTKER